MGRPIGSKNKQRLETQNGQSGDYQAGVADTDLLRNAKDVLAKTRQDRESDEAELAEAKARVKILEAAIADKKWLETMLTGAKPPRRPPTRHVPTRADLDQQQQEEPESNEWGKVEPGGAF